MKDNISESSQHEDHSEGLRHDHNSSGIKNIATAFFLNFSFTIIELVGGLITNSVAILSDAVHDFGDSISLALAWYFEKIAKRTPNKKFTYGYKRFSLLGAVINSVVLLVGSSVVIFESIRRIANPQEVHAKGMLLLAVLGVVVNGIAVLRTRTGKGINEKVISLHLLEDVLGWAAVLVVSIVMLFVNLPVLDPILSVAISLYVLYNVYKNLKNTLNVILQGVPSEMNLTEIEHKIQQIPHVLTVHDLHVWSLDSLYNIASLHVVLNSEDQLPSILKKTKDNIKELMKKEGIEHITVEFETNEEDCVSCN
jgi:cobalt-zinc-cadmium efflux system protein